MTSILENYSWILQSPYAIGGLTAVATIAALDWLTTPANAPDLPGPRGWPIVGSIFQRGADSAHTYHQWSQIYGPVFRMRLGTKWFVVINGAEEADELLASAKYAASFQSRPLPWSIKLLLGKSDKRALSLGMSPYNDLLKEKRKLAVASVSPAAARSYEDIIDRASQFIVRGLGKSAGSAIDPFPVFFEGAIVLAVTVVGGASVEEAEHLFDEIPHPMERLGQLRNINGQYRDYLPFLRLLPNSKLFNQALDVARFRNDKLSFLINRSRRLHDEGTAKPCVSVAIVKENKNGMEEDSLTSVANSMVSAGLDAHMPNTLLWGLGLLAANPDIQAKAYEAVIRQEKFGSAINIEKDNYLFAFVKEIGRYFTTFRLSIGRETYGKDFFWNGHYIPSDTTVLCNTHAMNRDAKRFSEPEAFRPERFMTGSPEAEPAVPHYGFGLGRRNCPAMVLVHKELYTIYKHILLNYQISHADGEREFHPVHGCADGMAFNQGPKPFRISVKVRDQQKLDEYLKTEF